MKTLLKHKVLSLTIIDFPNESFLRSLTTMDILLCSEMNIPLPQNKTIILNNWDLFQWIQLFILFRQVFTCQAIKEANNKHENNFFICVNNLELANMLVSHMRLANA